MRISDWSSDVCSSDLARSNLQDADARDLWVYGTRSIAAQAATLANLEAGTLRMRTLEGPVAASIDGADTRLLNTLDRKGVVWGKGVSVRGDLGGGLLIKKKNRNKENKIKCRKI